MILGFRTGQFDESTIGRRTRDGALLSGARNRQGWWRRGRWALHQSPSFLEIDRSYHKKQEYRQGLALLLRRSGLIAHYVKKRAHHHDRQIGNYEHDDAELATAQYSDRTQDGAEAHNSGCPDHFAVDCDRKKSDGPQEELDTN